MCMSQPKMSQWWTGKCNTLQQAVLPKLFISSVKQGRNEISLVFLSFTASVSRIAQEITDEFA